MVQARRLVTEEQLYDWFDKAISDRRPRPDMILCAELEKQINRYTWYYRSPDGSRPDWKKNAEALGHGRWLIRHLQQIVPTSPPVSRNPLMPRLLGRCWFDRERTDRARECLANYHCDWNDRMGVFRETPVHDWSSDCADAMRTLAMGLRETAKPSYYEPKPPQPPLVYPPGSPRGMGWMR